LWSSFPTRRVGNPPTTQAAHAQGCPINLTCARRSIACLAGGQLCGPGLKACSSAAGGGHLSRPLWLPVSTPSQTCASRKKNALPLRPRQAGQTNNDANVAR
jgi:hypothetical protein